MQACSALLLDAKHTPAGRIARGANSAVNPARNFKLRHDPSGGGLPGATKADDLSWKVIEAIDAEVRGNIERDRRIEDERDRVLVAAVTLADSDSHGDADDVAAARRHLVGAIDYLEEAVMRFGTVNRTAGRLGYGRAGDRVSTER